MGTTHAVISAVAAHYGVERDRLLSQDRSMPLVRHRQVAMAIARDMGFPLLAIAAELGRDHSTVLYGIRKVHALLDDGDVALARDIRAIIEKMCGERAA